MYIHYIVWVMYSFIFAFDSIILLCSFFFLKKSLILKTIPECTDLAVHFLNINSKLRVTIALIEE